MGRCGRGASSCALRPAPQLATHAGILFCLSSLTLTLLYLRERVYQPEAAATLTLAS